MIRLLVCCSLFVPLQQGIAHAQGDYLMALVAKNKGGLTVDPKYRPKATIVIDAKTSEIIWSENIDEVRNPASMSKVLVTYMVFEAISRGELSEDTVITATETDERISKLENISNAPIVAGVEYPVRELIKMMLVPSSNVATIMLASQLSKGDLDAFITQMNDAAKALGMTSAKFHNISGAETEAYWGLITTEKYDMSAANEASAKDLAILAQALLSKYPQVIDYTKDLRVKVMEGTPYEQEHAAFSYTAVNDQNLYGIEGLDGLKSGSSPTSGYNYIATAKRGDQRFITVVLGVGNFEDLNAMYMRYLFGDMLLEQAFAEYTHTKVLDKGTYESDGYYVDVPEDVYALVKNGQTPGVAIENNKLYVESGLTKLNAAVDTGMPVTTREIPKPMAIVPYLLGGIGLLVTLIGLGWFVWKKQKQ